MIHVPMLPVTMSISVIPMIYFPMVLLITDITMIGVERGNTGFHVKTVNALAILKSMYIDGTVSHPHLRIFSLK